MTRASFRALHRISIGSRPATPLGASIRTCRARCTLPVRWCPDSAGMAGSASSVQPRTCRGFPALHRNLRRTLSPATVGPSERSAR
jgi:hypothetical protein